MPHADPHTALRPHWWNASHALSGVIALSISLAAILHADAYLWAGIAFSTWILSGVLQWQMGALDAQQGRGRDLLVFQRIAGAAALLAALTHLHIAFAGAFIALPLAVAHLPDAHTRRAWILLSAIGAVLIFATDVPLPWRWTIPVLTLVCAAIITWLPQRADTPVELPEDSKPTTQPTRSRLLSRDAATQRAQDITTERLHELITIVRASTRGHFAAIYWLDDAQTTLLPTVIETASPRNVYDGPIATQDALPSIDLNDASIQEFQHQNSPAWYSDTDASDVGANVLVTRIQDEGILLGVLLIERHADRGAFHKADRVAARKCAHLIALQRRDEQAAISAAKTSHDLQVVALAAEQLSDTLNEEEVYRIGEALYGDLVADVHVMFVRQTHNDELEIAHISEGWTDFSVGDTLPSHHSLLALAMDRRHALPYRQGGEEDDPSLFGLRAREDDLRRHLVCPLVSGRIAHSAVVLRVPDTDVFHRTARERLGLLSNQIAAALGIARAYETMAQRAAHDGMTQLLNHMAFQEHAAQALDRAERSARPVSALLLDIDHFKSVNDTYGHAVGDEVIRAVAGVIREQVRRVDIAARYGGEEFVILLEDTDIDGAYLFAERLRSRIESLTHHAENIVFHATISIGIAAYPYPAQDQKTLLEQADAALYQSKNNGRNQVTVWQEAPTPAPSMA